MLLLMALSCFEQEKDTGLFVPLDVFCDDVSEAGLINIKEGGATGSNGRLEAQLISDTGSARDASVIGNATYILESLDVGGGERLGQANPLGEIDVTLGEGRWSLRVEGVTGCSNDIQFEIRAEMTHEMCVVLFCAG